MTDKAGLWTTEEPIALTWSVRYKWNHKYERREWHNWSINGTWFPFRDRLMQKFKKILVDSDERAKAI